MTKKTFLETLLLGAMLPLANAVSLWFIVGSSHLYFSGMSLFSPLAGIYASAASLAAVWGLSFLSCLFFKASLSPLALIAAYHIPSQLAALYWKIIPESTRLRLLGALIPLACMMLFGLHPEGRHALLYTIYWIIPALTLLIPHDNRWLHALGSTFTAHAVGSTLWIWTHPAMTAATWLGLIPVVAAERIILASAVWGFAYAIDCVRTILSQTNNNNLIQEASPL